MSLEANRNSLPPGHLTKLLKEAGLKKVDLEKGRNIDGHITINKRTLIKLDKGLQVQKSTLEKLRQILKLDSVADLFPISGSDTIWRHHFFGQKPWDNARFAEATPEPLDISSFLMEFKFREIEYATGLAGLRDDQFRMLVELEDFINRHTKNYIGFDQPKQPEEQESLKVQLKQIQDLSKFETLVEDIRSSGIELYVYKFDQVISEAIRFPGPLERVAMYNYVKKYYTISNFAVAVISKEIKNITFYVNVGEIVPTVDQLISDPQRYFSTGEGAYCGYMQLEQPDGTIFGYDGESKARAFSHDEELPDIIQKGDIK